MFRSSPLFFAKFSSLKLTASFASRIFSFLSKPGKRDLCNENPLHNQPHPNEKAGHGAGQASNNRHFSVVGITCRKDVPVRPIQSHNSDLLVIGGGLAGERVALEAASGGYAVTILSQVPPRRSHSTAAQGGMQASLGNSPMGKGDHPDLHFADTVRGSDWGCDQQVARLFSERAPEAVRQMAAWGVPWTRVTESGKNRGFIAGRKFGGTRKWRACFTADGTGHSLLYTMDSRVEKCRIPIHDRMEALSLIHDGHRCFGAVCRCLRTGDLVVYTASATVLATGGCGMLYQTTTNGVASLGTGMAMALETGVVPLGNMEAVQFHPTALVPSGILITEGARGDGGVLRDCHHHRFMPDYEPAAKDLAFRDVVARTMVRHIKKGNGVESPTAPIFGWICAIWVKNI